MKTLIVLFLLAITAPALAEEWREYTVRPEIDYYLPQLQHQPKPGTEWNPWQIQDERGEVVQEEYWDEWNQSYKIRNREDAEWREYTIRPEIDYYLPQLQHQPEPGTEWNPWQVEENGQAIRQMYWDRWDQSYKIRYRVNERRQEREYIEVPQELSTGPNTSRRIKRDTAGISEDPTVIGRKKGARIILSEEITDPVMKEKGLKKGDSFYKSSDK